ncbi:DNA polymerase subunit gamma-2, mitochondrial-like isoform X1 [Uloborus diversus]|uniref:DNA polymerase subunit gamma-2, mitochondrial-like isoform X1 n=1 Tax=Uloborus diversus TaxID=327109 RepID=UPI00240A5DB6|nr:DNA polymerase subunit gamma-2, mitochondrial-like isoform X1 [Uloborus diversus]
MQPELMNGFKKILFLCQKTGILQVGSSEKVLKTVHYGPLGSLLRRNIFAEWLCSILRNHEFATYPVELQNPREKFLLSQKLSDAPPESLLLDAVESYFQIFPMNGSVLPFGIAVYGPCINKNKRIAEQNLANPGSFLRDLESWTSLSLAFFCPPKKSMDWFHYWSKYRYRWWRKFSNVPSKFSLSDVTESSGSQQQLSVILQYPWGKEKVETITLYDDNNFKELCMKYGFEQKMSNFSVPAVVTCETELDLAAFAYLTSDFSEKWRENELRNMFQFHVKLAPYKVCLCLSASSIDTLKKLSDVANHLMKEFRKGDITVFPHYDVLSSNESQLHVFPFCRYDEMGVPYSVALNENTLSNGVAGLRNRDTTLQEQVHVTELTLKLQRYLQIMATSSQAT